VSEHSLLGASGAHRWLACPGSFNLTRQAPARPSSIYAARGTLAHTYIEEAITDHQINDTPLVIPETEAGSLRQVEQHVIEVDEDFVAGVNLMLDYVGQQIARGRFVRAEFRVALDAYFADTDFKPPVRMFGRVDAAFHDKAELEIVDFKNGVGILVDPKDNAQMLFYAAGVLVELDDPDRDPIERVTLTVVQPHARTPEKIRSVTLDVLDVVMWVDDVLIPGVQRAAAPDAPLVPGPWCRFCPASFACPELYQKAVAVAQRDFSDDGISLPSDPAVLGKWLTIADQAETWIKALRAFAVEQLEKQVRVPGWTLGPTRPVRRWADEKRTGGLVLQNGFTLDEAYDVSLRSPAQIEKLMKARRKEDLWRRTFAPLVESHSSGVKLVPNDIASDFPEEG
jgi:hypothetical protein